MKTRSKITLTIHTRQEAEATLGGLTLVTCHQLQATSQMDAEIAAVKQKYEGNLAAYAEDIKQKTAALLAWAQSNPDAFPKDRKTIQLVHGKFGFRTGTPKLELLNKRWNWEAVLKKLIDLGDLFSLCIRTKQEVDKDFILSQYASGETDAEELATFGVKVGQAESFFVEPDLTQYQPRQTEAA